MSRSYFFSESFYIDSGSESSSDYGFPEKQSDFSFHGPRVRAVFRQLGVVEFDTSLNAIQELQKVKAARNWKKAFNPWRQRVSKAAAEDLEEKLMINDGDDRDTQHGHTAEDKLKYLNAILNKCGKGPQVSITQAKKKLRTVHINVFDLAAGRIVVHASAKDLMQYSTSLMIKLDRDIAKEFRLNSLLRCA